MSPPRQRATSSRSGSSSTGTGTAPVRTRGPRSAISWLTSRLIGTGHLPAGFGSRSPARGDPSTHRLLPQTLPGPALSAALAHEAHPLEGDLPVDRLAHVVDREASGRDGHEGFHLDAGPGMGAHPRLDPNATRSRLRRELHADRVEGKGMGEGNP